MQVHQGLENLPTFNHAILSVGTYDGVHIGHQYIINRLKTLAKKRSGESVLLTFHPHPRLVLNPINNDLKLITTIEEKARLLDKMGLDHLVIAPFTKAFSQMEPEEYIANILVKHIHPEMIVIGYDHRYGKGRSGDINLLRKLGPKYGYSIEEIPAQTVDEITVSSTKVREALLRGNVETANEFLAHPFSLTGIVVHGEKLGRIIGYPTANLEVQNPYKLIPPAGVYAVWVNVDGQRYKGALSIGYRPTFTDEHKLTIEVFLLDFEGDLYGKEIDLVFVRFIRTDKKFDGAEALVKQIEKDVSKVNKILERSSN